MVTLCCTARKLGVSDIGRNYLFEKLTGENLAISNCLIQFLTHRSVCDGFLTLVVLKLTASLIHCQLFQLEHNSVVYGRTVSDVLPVVLMRL